MPFTAAATVPPCGPGCVASVTAAELLRLADDLRTRGQDTAADATLRALFADADPEMRREARFRLARALVARQRYVEAVAQLERILAERPDAAPARLLLAQALALAGEDGRSLREFARVQAGALPADVARAVAQLVSTLRSTRPFGGSVEFGLAPDSNPNDATAASTVLVGGLPFTLDPAARAHAGIGLEAAGQLFWRLPLGGTTRLVVNAVGRGTVYRQPDLDNGTAEVSIGPEFAGRVRPALFAGRRWYGGRGYAWSLGATGQWLHPLTRTTVLDVDGRIERDLVGRSRAADETGVTVSAAIEHALRPSLFLRVSAFANRQQARGAAFTSSSLGAGALLAQVWGPLTIYGQANYTRLWAAQSLLGGRRRDRRVALGGGVAWRRLRLLGASPVIRLTRVVNASTADLYDSARTRAEIALTRTF